MPRYGPAYDDRPVLAVGETKFFGEPVAAVAAETEDAAEAAAALIRVDYEELPAVLTVEQALDPASPLVQDPALRAEQIRSRTPTSCSEWRFGWGDVDGVPADCVIENDYTFPMVTHFAIEPHAFMAAPDPEGVTIWSPIQHPLRAAARRRVGAAAGRSRRVRIIAPDPGGGFGGKGWPKFEPLMAFLALRTGRPVRLVLTLEETFQQVRRTSARDHVRTGFDATGGSSFRTSHADFLIGAYADIGGRVVSKASYAACGPYRTPHARVIARALLSHTTPSTAFRGFGTPQASWAVESQLNEAAAALGIDPVEIRRRNVPRKRRGVHSRRHAGGRRLGQRARQRGGAIGWTEPLPANRGRGISLGLEELVDRVGVVCDRAAALRRQRVGAVRHVGHGPGRAHGAHADRRRRSSASRPIASPW